MQVRDQLIQELKNIAETCLPEAGDDTCREDAMDFVFGVVFGAAPIQLGGDLLCVWKSMTFSEQVSVLNEAIPSDFDKINGFVV
jgi:hypothetical protein